MSRFYKFQPFAAINDGGNDTIKPSMEVSFRVDEVEFFSRTGSQFNACQLRTKLLGQGEKNSRNLTCLVFMKTL